MESFIEYDIDEFEQIEFENEDDYDLDILDDDLLCFEDEDFLQFNEQQNNSLKNINYLQKHSTGLFPYNLMEIVLNELDDKEKLDFDFTVKSVLNTVEDVLPEINRKVIRLKYEQHFTNDKIAKELNISNYEVLSYHEWAISVLKDPYILNKINVISKSEYIQVCDENIRLKNTIKQFEKCLITINNCVKDAPFFSIRVIDLDLSVRTTNALKKGGFNTLDDITHYLYKGNDLEKIKCMSFKSISELLAKLIELGIEIPNKYYFKYLD